MSRKSCVRSDRLNQICRILIGGCPEIERSRLAWYVRSGWLVVSSSSGCRRRVRVSEVARRALGESDPVDSRAEHLITVIDGPRARAEWLRSREADPDSSDNEERSSGCVSGVPK
jgi:hypothetical protein